MVYVCNGAVVGPAAYAAITAVQGPGGATAANVAALAAVISQSAGDAGGNGSGIPLSAFLDPSAPLPSNWTAGLSAPALAALAATLGKTPAELAAARNVSQLLPAGGPGAPVPGTAAALLLLALPLDTVAALLAGTECSAAPGPPERGSSAGTCVCPLDYAGAACELPRHYTCSVVVADPAYHACVAANGAGFEAPTEAAPGRLLASAHGGLASRDYAYLETAAPLAYSSGPPPPQGGQSGGDDRSSGGGGAALLAAHDAALADPSHPYGPGSGVAVPASAAALAALPQRLGLHLDADTARLPRADATGGGAGAPPLTSYSPASDGDPQCLWINRARVAAAAAGDPAAAAAAAAGRSSALSGPAYAAALAAAAPHAATGWPAGVVPLRVRVQCSFASSPGAASLTAGRTLVDPAGRPYDRDPGPQASPAALLAAAYTHPPLYADVASAAPGAWRCNGSSLTAAGAAADLAARGYNASAPPPGRAPYFGGALGCIEARLAYAVGGPRAADPPFALSQAPLLPLALLVTPVSPVLLAPQPAALVPLGTPDALTGGVDVVVPLHLAGLPLDDGGSAAGGLWAGGRLVLEARVVQAPEGADVGPQSPSALGTLPRVDPVQALAAVTAREGGDWVRVPLLLGGPVARITLDDVGWAAPVQAVDHTALALGVSLAVLVTLALAAWWLQRRYDWWGKCRRDLF